MVREFLLESAKKEGRLSAAFHTTVSQFGYPRQR
jgi:hypothetical protein